MIVYLDSSVVLRILLGQKNSWSGWGRWEKAYSSILLNVECRRVVDRLRLESILNDHGVAHVGTEIRRLDRVISRIALTRLVTERASMTMPTVVKTLDAIHLASAVLLRERRHPDLTFVTHDIQQATCARAYGFDCLPGSVSV